jgi:hypothetical protein
MRNAFIIVSIGVALIGSCFIHNIDYIAFIGAVLALSGTIHCIMWLVFSEISWYEDNNGKLNNNPHVVAKSWLNFARIEAVNVFITGVAVIYIFVTNV